VALKQEGRAIVVEIGGQFYPGIVQAIILGYIVDIYLPDFRLVIEVDGVKHEETKKYDTARTRHLQKTGIKVLRFTNKEIFKELTKVNIKIRREMWKRRPVNWY